MLVIGHWYLNKKGKPWSDRRTIYVDGPHPYKKQMLGWHLNSEVFENLDHKEINPGTRYLGSAKFIKGLGLVFAVVTLGADIHNIITSDDAAAEVVKTITVWGGAATGAAIGSAIVPGVGTLVGGVVGGLVTATIVYW